MGNVNGDIPLQKRIKLEGENQTLYVTVPASTGNSFMKYILNRVLDLFKTN